MSALETDGFLSQTGKTTLAIARLLLAYNQGDRIPRVMDLARELKVGNGTVQEALNCLTRTGAIRIEARGSRGTSITEIDYQQLWRYAGNDWIVGSMPLPYTLRYEGLATALHAQMEETGLPFNMTYQRGALTRGEMVRKGHYHYAVMSLLAAEHFIKQNPDVSIITQLPVHTYLMEHILVSAVPRDQIRRIGVEPVSLDELLLTEEELRIHPEWKTVAINRLQVLDVLQEGLCDALIWNRDGLPSVLPAGIEIFPLEGDSKKRDSATQAAIVALKDAPVRKVLMSIFSPEKITAIQQEVYQRQRLPLY
ncbi:helix-turn-helix protein [Thermosporothrix hazakensis]|jgi:hypothetical protein|uniref:Helix-turn-helix protein n=2 Tax=Thermosporothrix TaxID=768650 RepID=A0A326UCE8_THEHA|nr:GntR family transcriptional regulator YhfZ [Thermosporothrix hazakensis]PZW22959.1 helix-turn-helix protein [Thermosporothrix hazakensis]BBH90051.1 hypothetical protein KTC_48020 [Thermosporothrix sp. COM3]GCE48272.1 hypothetical protein KTH_31410 [Thermosporothrix hazakensis]